MFVLTGRERRSGPYKPCSTLQHFPNHRVYPNQSQSNVSDRSDYFPNSKECGRGCIVHEDVVLLKLLDIGLDLVHLGLKHLLARHLADGVELSVMAFLLIVAHEDLPFLLKGGDELLALLFGHELPLLVHGSLLLNLHLSNQIILVLDLLLELRHVLGNLAISLLLQEVLLLGRGQFRGYQKKTSTKRNEVIPTCEDILNCVGNDEVFVRNEALDRLIIALRHCRFWWCYTLKLCHYRKVEEQD